MDQQKAHPSSVGVTQDFIQNINLAIGIRTKHRSSGPQYIEVCPDYPE